MRTAKVGPRDFVIVSEGRSGGTVTMPGGAVASVVSRKTIEAAKAAAGAELAKAMQRARGDAANGR